MTGLYRNSAIFLMVAFIHIMLLWIMMQMKPPIEIPQTMVITLVGSLERSSNTDNFTKNDTTVQKDSGTKLTQAEQRPQIETIQDGIAPLRSAPQEQRQYHRPQPGPSTLPTSASSTPAPDAKVVAQAEDEFLPDDEVPQDAGQNENTDKASDMQNVTNTLAFSRNTQNDGMNAQTQQISEPSHRASYLRNAQPEYPYLSRRYREEGQVVLRVLVTAQGTAGRVELKSSSGHVALDTSALVAVRRWRFVPAKQAGTPIDMWYSVAINFTLNK